MAVKELVVLAILLCCLLVLQQINQAIVAKCRRLNDQRRLLLTQFYGYNLKKMPQKRKKAQAILDKTKKNIFVVGKFLEWCHVGGRVEGKFQNVPYKFFQFGWLVTPIH